MAGKLVAIDLDGGTKKFSDKAAYDRAVKSDRYFATASDYKAATGDTFTKASGVLADKSGKLTYYSDSDEYQDAFEAGKGTKTDVLTGAQETFKEVDQRAQGGTPGTGRGYDPFGVRFIDALVAGTLGTATSALSAGASGIGQWPGSIKKEFEDLEQSVQEEVWDPLADLFGISGDADEGAGVAGGAGAGDAGALDDVITDAPDVTTDSGDIIADDADLVDPLTGEQLSQQAIYRRNRQKGGLGIGSTRKTGGGGIQSAALSLAKNTLLGA